MIYCTCNVRKHPLEIYQVYCPSAVYVLQSSQRALQHVSNEETTQRTNVIPPTQVATHRIALLY